MRPLLPFLLLWLAPHLAFADFESARAAANRGDFKTARTEWERLAAKDDRDAIFSLGRLYARGDGVERDFPKAFRYFERAAELGHQRAVLNLGTMYFHGDGVEKDLSKARDLLTKAEAFGLNEATTFLKSLSPTEEAYPAPASGAAVAAPAESRRACEGADARDSARAVWVVALQPGDTFPIALCKLSRVPQVSIVRGTTAGARLSSPIDYSFDGSVKAARAFGSLKELRERSAASPSAPSTILVTDPLVSVQTIPVQGIPFNAVLWFRPIEQVGPYAELPTSTGSIPLVSGLHMVSLTSRGTVDSLAIEKLLTWISAEYPDATRTESSTPEGQTEPSMRVVTFRRAGVSVKVTQRGTWVGIRYES